MTGVSFSSKPRMVAEMDNASPNTSEPPAGSTPRMLTRVGGAKSAQGANNRAMLGNGLRGDKAQYPANNAMAAVNTYITRINAE